jgi:hypothetical protein
MYKLIGVSHPELFREVQDFAAPTSSTTTNGPVFDGIVNNATPQVTSPAFYTEDVSTLQNNMTPHQNEVFTPQYEIPALHCDVTLLQGDTYGSQTAQKLSFPAHHGATGSNNDAFSRYNFLSGPTYYGEPSAPIHITHQPWVEIAQSNALAQYKQGHPSIGRTSIQSSKSDLTDYKTGHTSYEPSCPKTVVAPATLPSAGMYGVGINPTSGECLSFVDMRDDLNSCLALDTFQNHSQSRLMVEPQTPGFYGEGQLPFSVATSCSSTAPPNIQSKCLPTPL